MIQIYIKNETKYKNKPDKFLKRIGFILQLNQNYLFATNLGSLSITVPQLSQVLNSSEL